MQIRVKEKDHCFLNSNVVLVVLPVLIVCRFCLLKTLNFKGAAGLELGFLLLSLEKVEVWTMVVLPTEQPVAYSIGYNTISAGKQPTVLIIPFEIILDIKMR